jgi:Fungal fucose-specific lectin
MRIQVSCTSSGSVENSPTGSGSAMMGHTRVYVASGGTITEHCWDEGTWSTGAFSAPGQQASATSWVDLDGQRHIRVYVASGGDITEHRWDGGAWSTGAFSEPGQQASATSWVDVDGQPHIRVYVASSTGVREYCWDNGRWSNGTYTSEGGNMGLLRHTPPPWPHHRRGSAPEEQRHSSPDREHDDR